VTHTEQLLIKHQFVSVCEEANSVLLKAHFVEQICHRRVIAMKSILNSTHITHTNLHDHEMMRGIGVVAAAALCARHNSSTSNNLTYNSSYIFPEASQKRRIRRRSRREAKHFSRFANVVMLLSHLTCHRMLLLCKQSMYGTNPKE